MKIAVDAMGGDHGPAVVVEGAAAAAREFGASIALVGDKAAIEREVARLGAQGLDFEIRHASQVVSMAESPSHPRRWNGCFSPSTAERSVQVRRGLDWGSTSPPRLRRRMAADWT